MIDITIDNQKISVKSGTTLLDAAKKQEVLKVPVGALAVCIPEYRLTKKVFYKNK